LFGLYLSRVRRRDRTLGTAAPVLLTGDTGADHLSMDSL
jgi:hypothetical protein